MKKNIQRSLAAAFDAPPPVKKRSFFRNQPIRYVNHFSFILTQARYIRKSTWAASAALFGLALALGRYAPANALWVLAALTPMAALTAVTESARSGLYGMEELELAARFSLKSAVMARMGAIGLGHLALFCLMALCTRQATDRGVLPMGVYLLTPYLLTSMLGLAALRRIRGRESVYVCAGIALLVSGIHAAVQTVCRELYAPENMPWWLAALAVCLWLTGREYGKIIKKTEELSWSL